MLQQVEERRLGPVDVVDQRDHRRAGRQDLEHLARRPVDLVQRIGRRAQPGRRGHAIDHVAIADEGQQLGLRLLGLVVVADVGRAAASRAAART